VTSPLDDDLRPAPGRSRVPVELIGLLLTLIGAAVVVWGVWQLDWRAGVVTLGALIVTAGLVLGIEAD
jgi:hypothetical protein